MEHTRDEYIIYCVHTIIMSRVTNNVNLLYKARFIKLINQEPKTTLILKSIFR